MAATPQYGLPAPDLPNPADGPTQILALATAVENLLTNGTLKMAGGKIEISPPTAGNHPVTLTYWTGHLVIGPASAIPAAGALPDGAIYFGTA